MDSMPRPKKKKPKPKVIAKGVGEYKITEEDGFAVLHIRLKELTPFEPKEE